MVRWGKATTARIGHMIYRGKGDQLAEKGLLFRCFTLKWGWGGSFAHLFPYYLYVEPKGFLKATSIPSETSQRGNRFLRLLDQSLEEE